MIIFTSIFFLFFSSATSSDFPEIYGCFCEGGIISGRLKDKKDIIIIDEKKINVNQDGDFIFAFGRKFKEKLKITVNGINNEFDIIDKKYKKEIIRGLPKRKS